MGRIIFFLIILPLTNFAQGKFANITLDLSNEFVKESFFPIKCVFSNSYVKWDTTFTILDNFFHFKVPIDEPLWADIKLFAIDSSHFFETSSILYTADSFNISVISKSHILRVEGGETNFVEKNRYLLFDIPYTFKSSFDESFINLREDSVFITNNLLLSRSYEEYERNILKTIKDYSGFYFVLVSLYKFKEYLTVNFLQKCLQEFNTEIKATSLWLQLTKYATNEKTLLRNNNLPDIKLQNQYDKVVTQNNILEENKITYINFWSSFSSSSIEEIKFIDQHYDLIDTSKVKIISISLDTLKYVWTKAYKTENIRWSHYLDINKNISDAFNLNLLPDGIILNHKGHIVKRFVNANDLIAYLKKNKLIKL